MTSPTNNLCSASDCALIVIDIQPTLTAAMVENEAEQMINNSCALIQAAHTLNIPIFVTEQYPQGLGETDSSIIEALSDSVHRFSKTGFSCCAAEGFNSALSQSGKKQLVLVGQEAHVCVLQTALELQSENYSVYVAEDSTCSRKQEHRFFALERMRQAGITITNYESVIFEWIRDASHPDFKTLSKLIQ